MTTIEDQTVIDTPENALDKDTEVDSGKGSNAEQTKACNNPSSSGNSSFDEGVETSSCDTISSKDVEELDVNDILDLYDNVEFYKEVKEEANKSHIDDKECLDSGIRLETDFGIEDDNINNIDKAAEQSKVKQKSCTKFKVYDTNFTQLVTTDTSAAKSLGTCTESKDFSICTNLADIGSKGNSNLVTSELKPSDTHCLQTCKETDSLDYTDHWKDYKSQNISCNSQVRSKQSPETTEEVADDLQFQKREQGNDLSTRSCSKKARLCDSGNSEYHGKLQVYQSVDNSKSDNRVNGSLNNSNMEESVKNGMQEWKLSGSVRNKSSNSQNTEGQGLNLDEFLEEINESLDELISNDIVEDKRSSGSKNKSYASKCVGFGDPKLANKPKIKKNDKNGQIYPEKNTVSCKSALNDGNYIDSSESVSVSLPKVNMGENVVETEAGYYWLTCSIEEQRGEVNQDDKERVTHNSDIRNKDEIDKVNRSNSNENNFKRQKLKRCKQKKIGEKNCFENGTNNSQKINTGNLKEKSAIKKEAESRSHYLDHKVSKPHSDSRNDTAQNFTMNNIKDLRKNKHSKEPEIVIDCATDIDDNIRKSDDISRYRDSQLLGVNRADKDKDTRKYSCPENVFRVFKVVSVDIPKLNDFVKDEAGECRSQSFSTLPNYCSKTQHKNSFEQKKNKILEYLAEITSITSKRGGPKALENVKEQNKEEKRKESKSEEKRKSVKKLKRGESDKSKDNKENVKRGEIDKCKNDKENVVLSKKKFSKAKCESSKCDKSTDQSVMMDIEVEPPAMFRDDTKKFSGGKDCPGDMGLVRNIPLS